MFIGWADPRGNAIRGRPVDWVEQAHSTGPDEKNTGNFIGPSSRTVAEITLQRTDTTHDLSSESREAITIATHAKPLLTNIRTPNNHMHLHRNTPILHSQTAPSNDPHENHTRPSAPTIPSCAPIITSLVRMGTRPTHRQTENRHITTTHQQHILLTTPTTHSTPAYRARITNRASCAHKPP